MTNTTGAQNLPDKLDETVSPAVHPSINPPVNPDLPKSVLASDRKPGEDAT